MMAESKTVNLTPFIASNACRSRQHCQACRDQGAEGVEFWASAGTVYEKPDECPWGVPKGYREIYEVTPASWGPSLWARLHLWGLSDPERDGGEAFLDNLAGQLPCGDCAETFRQYRADRTVPYGGDVRGWVDDLHNLVSKKLGKREWDREESYSRWKDVTRA